MTIGCDSMIGIGKLCCCGQGCGNVREWKVLHGVDFNCSICKLSSPVEAVQKIKCCWTFSPSHLKALCQTKKLYDLIEQDSMVKAY